MRMRKAVVSIAVVGLAVGLLSCGGSSTRAGGPDAVLRMIPADSLLCLRINNLDRTLGDLDRYLTGIAPKAVGPEAKAQLGGLLGNSKLAGVKTDGVFAVFLSAPADATEPVVLMQGLSILVPISDYRLFASSSPRLSQPDALGVSSLEGTPLFAAKAGGFVLIGLSADAGAFAAKAKTITAGAADSLAGVLDENETAQATGSPLWIRANIPAVAKFVGPGLAEKIRGAAAGAPMIPGGPMAAPFPKALLDLYAGAAEKLLNEIKSVAITVEPKPDIMRLGFAVAALPGTPMAGLLTKSRPSDLKDSKLLGYLKGGVVMSGASSFDPASLVRLSQMGLDLLSATEGTKLSEADANRVKSFFADLASAMGGETVFSFNMAPQAGAFYSMKYVFDLKDADKWRQLFDEGGDLMNLPIFASISDAAGMTAEYKVQHAVGTYQGVSIDSAKLAYTPKDPASPEGQAMMLSPFTNIEYRMAVVGSLGVMTAGADADTEIRKLIDLIKAGGPGPAGAEIKAAMEALPDAKNADFVATYNMVRMLGVTQAFMPGAVPAESLSSKSNMVLAFSIGDGQASFRAALPKEHLTEFVRGASSFVR